MCRRSSNDTPQTWRIGVSWNCFKSPNPFRFFFGLSFQIFRSSFPNSGYSMFPILILCWNFVSGLTVFVLDKIFLGFVSRRVGSLYFLFAGCLVKSVLSRLKLCETKCWQCSRNLMVYVFRCIWSACFATYVQSFHSCEGFALWSSSADINYLWTENVHWYHHTDTVPAFKRFNRTRRGIESEWFHIQEQRLLHRIACKLRITFDCKRIGFKTDE